MQTIREHATIAELIGLGNLAIDDRFYVVRSRDSRQEIIALIVWKDNAKKFEELL